VGRAIARLSRLVDHAASSAGLTLAQYRVLVFVAARPQRAAALAAKADVRRPTLSAIVAGMERSGLLRRALVAGDGRGVQFELTPEGRERLAHTEHVLTALLAEVARVGEANLDALGDELEAMLAGFEALAEPLVPAGGSPPSVSLAGAAPRRSLRSADRRTSGA
jgi:DNA-binding MarR family transcriptional regulator